MSYVGLFEMIPHSSGGLLEPIRSSIKTVTMRLWHQFPPAVFTVNKTTFLLCLIVMYNILSGKSEIDTCISNKSMSKSSI